VGTTHAIFRYGIQDLMPDNIHFIHGPGCPVCVLPTSRIDQALYLLEHNDIILCSYGDLLRVPATDGKSLLKAKAGGSDVRMVYSTQDALKIARDNPDREVLFFAIGFETTTPASAIAIQQAADEGLKNFTLFCNHVLTPAAIQNILESPEVREIGSVSIDGFFGPSHVSAIIGSRPYEFFAEEFQRPVVIAGFEPLDVMQSTLMLIHQINEDRFEVENEYGRVVTRDGNQKAQKLVAETFELRPLFEWRGLGEGLIVHFASEKNIRYLIVSNALTFLNYTLKRSKGANAPLFYAVQNAQQIANYLVQSASQKTQWDLAWSPPRGLVPLTGATGDLESDQKNYLHANNFVYCSTRETDEWMGRISQPSSINNWNGNGAMR